ncbi:hypothetical protein [Streptomyces sp. N35]|uniref:hypothetical protein n=1 Tax=Streptomyces sp. N35 TaxID=2795730 RepID=UPI0018F6FBBD|nr:hypothetical protein [Streptomyces sp. N35]
MAKPAWLQSQIDDRARTADALGAAADQMNTCRSIAAGIQAEGRDHTADPQWRSAVREWHQMADAHGIDDHDISAEVARRR